MGFGDDQDLDADWDDEDDDEWNDDQDQQSQQDNDDSDEDAHRYNPRVGPALDPYEDKPAARRAALAPLLGHERDETGLLPSVLRLGAEASRDKVEFLLTLPDTRRAVQALAPDEFALLIQEVGLEDCGELLALASPRQLQTCVDLDAWQGDELDGPEFSKWLRLVHSAGPALAERFVAAQEDGLLALWLAQHLRVNEVHDDMEIPEDEEHLEVFRSPDMTMDLMAAADDEELPTIRALINTLFRQSLLRGRALLRAIQWELPTQLTEDMLQFRNTRLDEMGMGDRGTAREMYAFVEPSAQKQSWIAQLRGTGGPAAAVPRPYLPDDEPPRLGLTLQQAMVGAFLPRVMLRLPLEDEERLRLALSRLCYRAQSARAAKPSAIGELPRWSRHAISVLGLGLQYASDNDEGYAAILLQSLPVVDIFRVGHSLTVLLHHQARKLRSWLGGDSHLAVLSPADADLVRGLCLPLPLVNAQVPEQDLGDWQQWTQLRSHLKGILGACQVLQTLAGQPLAAVLQRLVADEPLANLGTLFNTALARGVLGLPPPLAPLTVAQALQFRRVAFEKADIAVSLRTKAIEALCTLLAQPSDEATALTDLANTALTELADHWGPLAPGEFDPRFVGSAVWLQVDSLD